VDVAVGSGVSDGLIVSVVGRLAGGNDVHAARTAIIRQP
jgi:hypothetical protein